ncbi:TRIM3 [Branchiostoma lanceolatum]|uniref:TRIM3 protein n=1 Tax=Branchiostoma lanceolatum TaxID=7740 RepID=A0A8J9YYY9_BRALA|nr:TRIM3 [Branchiostoma lanceolatum]
MRRKPKFYTRLHNKQKPETPSRTVSTLRSRPTMAELSPLTRLFVKISDSLSEEDLRNLRAILAREGLGQGKVEQATPHEMFNMLEADNRIGKGNLGFLVQVLRSLKKGKLAEEAELVQQQERREEVEKVAAKYKASVEAAISKITQKVEALKSEITATAENCEQVEKEIQQHYKRLISKLQLEEQEMITRVQRVNRDREGELKDKMETELKKTKEAEISVQKMLDCKDDTEALVLRQDMEERFKKLSLQESDDRSGEGLTKVTFQPCSLSQVSGGSLSVFAGFSIDVQEPAVESLPCSVTVTTNKADLTGGDVAPQIEVTSPQGKTTLIQTTAHTGPPLAAGKGQTSRVRRVWGGEWRPQESGKHTLRVCMGGKKDLSSLTVDVGSNNPVLRFGQRGSQQGQFDGPRDVAVRGDRLYMYVADTWNQRVQVFDLSGKFCSSFSTTTNPGSLAVQTNGTIVVRSLKEVKTFSPSGKLVHKFPLGEYCTDPYGLAVQRDGRVVIADPDKHSIFLFEADGTLVKQVGGQGQGEGQFDKPRFVCVDKEDNIIVADKINHRVQVFDKNLNFKHKFGQKGRQPQNMIGPNGVSADSRGNIVLANIGEKSGDDVGGIKHSKKLQVFRPDGTWVSTISSDGDKLKRPHGVAVTEDGHVFVADTGHNCIRKYRYM